MAGDDDVLHPVVVDQRLQPAEPEQRVEDRASQAALLGGRPRGVAGVGPFGQRPTHDQPTHPASGVPLLAVEPPTPLKLAALSSASPAASASPSARSTRP